MLEVLADPLQADFRYNADRSLKAKDVVRHVRAMFPTLSAMKLSKVKDAEIDKELLKFERDSVVTHYKFGILYCAAEQTDENEMFCNSTLLSAFACRCYRG